VAFLKLLYVYPRHHTVSFTIVARKHIEYMKRLGLAEVEELDGLSLPSFTPHTKYDVILHPWIYTYHKLVQAKLDVTSEPSTDRLKEYLGQWRSSYGQLIAIDVCDSDRMSDYAVELLNQADVAVVPSNYCVEVYKSSGVKIPVYRVPHGVDPEWYSIPNLWSTAPPKSMNPILLDVYLYKVRKGKRLLLFWLWHSSTRKGWPEVREVYSKLVRERKDVMLLLKTVHPNIPEFFEVAHLGIVQVYGWLNEYEKMALYDLADVTLMLSRGGGFELTALESLARGVPVVTSNIGSWTEYVPPYLHVRVSERVRVFDNNVIHIGYGYKVDVEDAINKIHDILENYDDYKCKVEEWKRRMLSDKYRWDRIASMLAEVIKLKTLARMN
jgi:glycosyltransferase involved in cell wall biosynthesis